MVALASATAVETVTTLAPVVHVLNPATFDTFIQQNADKLVIVDFYTDCELLCGLAVGRGGGMLVWLGTRITD